MIHLAPLILDLGLILTAAAITTLLFKWIRQPLVLGYILAGLLVGPHIAFLPTVADEESITIWAEIGVIFLLFSLGLEFSFKKLLKVGGSASITAVVEVIFMLAFGFLVGKLMGWNTMDSIFLGGILSVSSTTIIIRAFEELGVKHKKFASLVFGALIVEDLVAILLLVLLSTLAVSQQFAGGEMFGSVLKLSFFLVLWFIAGIFLIPTFLKRTRHLMNDETMLVVSLALCLLMVILATYVGFSPALGAFIMGSILAETPQAERVEHLVKSVKDLFAAVFFVSVGMMIDPKMLIDHYEAIIIVTIVTVVGKFISTGGGALLSGQTLKTSVQTGMSLSQIGEFSFIIATLGVTLKVTSDFLYPIAVAVSAVTTFTTPYLIRVSAPVAQWIENSLPEKWVMKLNTYSSGTAKITTTSDWKILLRAYTSNILIQSVILISIIIISSRFFHPFVIEYTGNNFKGSLITVAVSFVLMAPFLWALAVKRIEKTAYSHLWLNRKLQRGPLIAIEIFRILLAVIFFSFALYIILDTIIAVIIGICLFAAVMFLFSTRLQAFYSRLEKRFLLNLNARNEGSFSNLIPWETHLAELVVAPESGFIGKTLEELALREKYGINIALIERGKLVIATPGREERLYPNDKLTIIGTDDQLASVKEELEKSSLFSDDADTTQKDLELQKLIVAHDSPICYKSIRDSGIRERSQGLVVGIERDNVRILNPDSDFVFKPGDTLYIVGNKKRVKQLLAGTA